MQLDKNLVGHRIKNIRLKLGLTMEKLGDHLNTSKGAVNNWEKGKSLPNNERLKKIAELGDMSVDELIYGDIETRIYNVIVNEIDKNFKTPHYHVFFDNESEGQEIIRDAIQNLKGRSLSFGWNDDDIALAFDEIATKEFMRRPYSNRHAIVYTNILLADLMNDVAGFFHKKSADNKYELRDGLSASLYDSLLQELEETEERIASYIEQFPDEFTDNF